MKALHATLRAYQVPKRGEAADTCRDAWASTLPQHEACALSRRHRLALADGATTASGSGPWAKLLTQASLVSAAPWSYGDYRRRLLPRLQAHWDADARRALPADAPWFAEAALEQGAFATLLRLEVQGTRWAAEGWGDSCLFHLREGRTLAMAPDLAAADFGNHPFLLPSVAQHEKGLEAARFERQGNLRDGDVLVLATDALACWVQTQPDSDWALQRLLALPTQAAFEAWVDRARLEEGLKDDDTTLLLLELT